MSTYLENDRADDGGALFLDGASHLILSSAVNIGSFTWNHANSMGGAIYF